MTSAQAKDTGPRKGKLKKYLVFFLLALTVSLLIYYFICGLTYSEGTRSGILTKVSKKGYVFKTYEGEMYLGGFSDGDGTFMPATVFYFSVRDKKVYEELESLQGKKLVLHYRQVYKNFPWQGDTDYFVYEVSPVKLISGGS